MLKEIIDKHQLRIKNFFNSKEGYLEFITSLGSIILDINPYKTIKNYVDFLYKEKLNKPNYKR